MTVTSSGRDRRPGVANTRRHQWRPSALILVVAILGLPRLAAGQSRWSLGGTLAVARFVDFNPAAEVANGGMPPIAPWFEPTLGVRVSIRTSDRVSLETEATVYPRYVDRQTPGEGYHGWGKVAFAGDVHVALTRGRLGWYVLAGGGAIRFGRVPAIVAVDSRQQPVAVVDDFSDVFWAVDAGGGAAWSVSRRTRFRIEAIDKLVEFDPKPRSLNPTYVRQIFSIGVGLDLRF